MAKDININIGDTFGRLTVINRALDYIAPDGKHKTRYLCECSCDKHTQIIVIGSKLKNGDVRSCGCMQQENGRRCGLSNTTHGVSSTKVAQSYYNMRNKYPQEIICPEWTGKLGVKKFYDDMAPTYKEGMVLGRIDMDEPFCPENCSWISSSHRNSITSRSRMITIDDTTMPMAQWAIALGYSKNLISDRLRMGWNERDAVLGHPGDNTTRNAIYFVDNNGFPIPGKN